MSESQCVPCPAGSISLQITGSKVVMSRDMVLGADSIKFCKLCPPGTYNNIPGSTSECIPCEQDQITKNMCGLGSVVPSPNFQVFFTRIFDEFSSRISQVFLKLRYHQLHLGGKFWLYLDLLLRSLLY